MKLYLDVESAGLKGPLNLIQWSIGREKIILNRPFQDDLTWLYSQLFDPNVCMVGYNIGFDLWKLYQHFKPSTPFNCTCLDLYNHALIGEPLKRYPFRGKAVIVIKAVHLSVVDEVERIVTEKLKYTVPSTAQIYCKRSKDKMEGFITLAFSIRLVMKLKELMAKLLGEKTLNYEDCWVLPIREKKNTPEIISEEERKSIVHCWQENEWILDNPKSNAWIYAKKDIEYLWKLENWLIEQGNTLDEDVNDSATHIVAYTKYHGFSVDVDAAKKLKKETEETLELLEEMAGINPRSPKERREALTPHILPLLPEIPSFDKKHLKLLLDSELLQPAGVPIAEALIKYGSLSQLNKQLESFVRGKLYPDFKIIGTATNRMSGRGGVNYQGVSREGKIRKLVLASQGGDFDSLEIGIAASFFHDEQMLADLDNGVDLHTQTACLLDLIDIGYDEAMIIKNNKGHLRHYEIKEARQKAKGINFAILYFATSHKISEILNCEPEEADEIINEKFFGHYPQLKRTREKYYKNIVTADTINWDKRSIRKMVDKVVDACGNERWLIVERELAAWLWEKGRDIAKEAVRNSENVPPEVIRKEHKGEQTIENAIYSALLGAAIGIQNTLYRQCGNFPIQSTGAHFTKKLMQRIWEEHRIPMMNIHDELLIPRGYEEKYLEIKETVRKFVEENKKVIKHLSMGWNLCKTWADK